MSQGEKCQVAAEVALALLEAMRIVDHPADRIKDEDVRLTMPRRLGLSAVVDGQMVLLREQVRRHRRLTGKEFAEFIHLVMRRPDAREVFFTMGSQLALKKVRRVTPWAPRAVRLYVVKKRIGRSLRNLFGQRLGGFASGPFIFEVSASPFVQVAPSGEACAVITGFCKKALHESVGRDLVLAKKQCETKGDRACRWTAETASSPW